MDLWDSFKFFGKEIVSEAIIKKRVDISEIILHKTSNIKPSGIWRTTKNVHILKNIATYC